MGPEHDASTRRRPLAAKKNQYRVLGIAFVVDQRGIGSRLLARYPTQPSAQKDRSQQPNLFFTLEARQMAKLFRAKKTLCNQPMTLDIGGTIFCCRSVLMEKEESKEQGAAKTGELELFSVIIALASEFHDSTLPHSGWFEGTLPDDHLDLAKYLTTTSDVPSGNKQKSGRMSSTFLSIRRVHLSLARFCRALEREESRCEYISRQIMHLFQIRHDRQKYWDSRSAAESPGHKQKSSNASTASSTKSKIQHKRTSSYATSVHSEMDESFLKGTNPQSMSMTEQEREQEVLEIMLSTDPNAGDDNDTNVLYGNLIRDLIDVFHSLSRNDDEFSPTPDSLLSERYSVVYVNQHIAVPIEAVTLSAIQRVANPLVRPYMTLLFPHAAPAELLDVFLSSGSNAPQRLQQVLLMANPRKSLSDIAKDANMPLHTTLEIATYLLSHGACVTAPVLTRSSRLACRNLVLIPRLSVDFARRFRQVSLFRFVAFVTSQNNLGEVLSEVLKEPGRWLREALSPFPDDLAAPDDPRTINPNQSPSTNLTNQWMEELEEFVFAMVVWLLSHQIVAPLEDFLVLANVDSTSEDGKEGGGGASSTTFSDDSLLQELSDAQVLDGRVSIPALCWRLSLDPYKVKYWATRHARLRVVSRVAAPGDDWDVGLTTTSPAVNETTPVASTAE